MEKQNTISCPSCQSCVLPKSDLSGKKVRYCPYCGVSLEAKPSSPDETQGQTFKEDTVSMIQGIHPLPDQVQFTLGQYQILNDIGKGGMGEVFLAYDTTCGRRIALKRIRKDLMEHPQIQNRFIKEARVTSQLTHPSIIPIYAIQEIEEGAFYTMPFVEGETLKQILRRARKQERKGEKDNTSTIPALIRIFLSICQAIAYAHSNHVLHRDIKPENIIVGPYGEVLLLDWGLAKLIKHSAEQTEEKEETEEKERSHPLHHLTNVGRVVGTVAYMAPERARGESATFKTDIYSLGVILYQILTLRNPFRRGTLKEFRETMHQETIMPPEEAAPYRDVPRSLSHVVMTCLSPHSDNRYDSVDELIHAVANFLEGKSEWFQIAELDVKNKEDWEFQENVLIAEHIAITRGTEVSDWVSLMISKASFTENTKIEARVRIGEKGHGLGFLMSIPEALERSHLNDGYCLWIGSDQNKSTKLLRSTVEVLHAPESFFHRCEWYDVRVEKIENNIHFYLNGTLQFSYISHLPLIGTHIGLLSRDADFQINDLKVFLGNQNVTVNCLAVPDSFLAHKYYSEALSEYRRIGYSFPGRAEGREAMFRAGVTLLEQGRQETDSRQKMELYDLALEEFDKLHGTPGAPLQYLGKGLVYKSLQDIEEEIKCFELGFRRYPHHPLLPVLHEQVTYRMHESAKVNRRSTYNFVLLAIRYIPDIIETPHVRKLVTSLKKHWEPLYFIQPNQKNTNKKENDYYAILLSFWLARPLVLSEIIDECTKSEEPSTKLLCDAFFSIIELGAWKFARRRMEEIFQDPKKTKCKPHDAEFDLVRTAIHANIQDFDQSLNIAFYQMNTESFGFPEERLVLYLMSKGIHLGNTEGVHKLYEETKGKPFTARGAILRDCWNIWGYLQDHKWDKADELLHAYTLESLTKENSLLHFLYGCWLYVAEGKEIAMVHFCGVFDVTYPRSWMLFSHYIRGEIIEGGQWFEKAFVWERQQLYRQLTLFYHCIGDPGKSQTFKQLAQGEIVTLP